MDFSKMRPFSIDDILAKPTVAFDLYVQLSEQKFVLIAKAGSRTNTEQLQKIKQRRVAYLFVHEEDYTQLVKKTITIAGMTFGPDMPVAKKIDVLDDATSFVFSEIRTLGVTDAVFNQAKNVNEATMNLVQSRTPLVTMIEGMGKVNNELVRHSLMVSSISAMLGVAHGWIAPVTLEKLSLGGLLHDIGMMKIPAEIATKPPEKMSYDETVIYEGHTEIGGQMLLQVREIPEDVMLIVAEHHERSDGSGYPRKIKDFQISPLARVVALADVFANMVVKSPSNLTPRPPLRALEAIELHQKNAFNREALQALRKMLDGEEKKLAG